MRSGLLVRELEGRGVDAVSAANSDELYQQLNYNRVDLFLLEQEQTGFLTGLDIVERLHNALLRPPTILLARSILEIQDRARALGIEQVVSSDTEPEKIAALVGPKLAALMVGQVPLCPRARKLVQECSNIQPLPQLLLKLVQLVESEDVGILEIAETVSADPRMTADLLKLINSSATGINRRVTSIFDAVNYLGPRRTVSLLQASSTLRAQGPLADRLAGADRLWFNRRSVIIASAASVFADRFGGVSADTAYTLGLLQDIGILVLFQRLGQVYERLIRRVKDHGRLRLDDAESRELGVCHSEVSGALLQKWQLPSTLVSTIAHHHRPGELVDCSTAERRFIQVMRAAEALADLVDGHTAHRLPVLMKKIADLGVADVTAIRTAITDAVAGAVKASEMFAISIPKDDKLDAVVSGVAYADVPEAAAVDPEEPAAEEPPRVLAPAATASPAPPRGNVTRLVVLEDDQGILDVVERFLDGMGVQVMACSNAKEAARLALEAEALLCDIHLGDADGLDLVQMLRSAGFRRPIIALSGDCRRETVARSILAGVNDYLAKPFTREALLAKLRRHGVLDREALAS